MKVSSHEIVALVPPFLTAGLVPEKFSAKVEFQPDGGYGYGYGYGYSYTVDVLW